MTRGRRRAPRRLPSTPDDVTENRPFELVLSAARRGEEWALTSLYRQHQPGLLGYLRGQRPDSAEDVASETWITVARGLASFRGGEDEFRRWLFATARRRLLDLVRAESRRPRTVAEASEPTGHASPDAETVALEGIATRRALEQLASLSPAEAEVILLRVVAGLSTGDVASITGRTPVSVRVLQHRALRRLAKLVGTALVTLQGRLAL
jgi:RNA polymerase sigma-70 factor, ECF subfamily